MDLPDEETTGKRGSIIKNEPTVSHSTMRHDDIRQLCTGLIMGKRRRETDIGKFEVHTT